MYIIQGHHKAASKENPVLPFESCGKLHHKHRAVSHPHDTKKLPNPLRPRDIKECLNIPQT